MLVKFTDDKWKACHAIMNVWLKDKTVYCGNCNANYDENNFPCCEDPVLADNWGHCKAIIDGIKDQKKELTNEYASNKKKNFRSTVKLPRRLLQVLEQYFKKYNQKLFDNPKEMRQFARRFKQFKVPVRL